MNKLNFSWFDKPVDRQRYRIAREARIGPFHRNGLDNHLSVPDIHEASIAGILKVKCPHFVCSEFGMVHVDDLTVNEDASGHNCGEKANSTAVES